MTKVNDAQNEKVDLKTKYGKWCCESMKLDISSGRAKIKNDKYISNGELIPSYTKCPYCRTEISLQTKSYIRMISQIYTERATAKKQGA